MIPERNTAEMTAADVERMVQSGEREDQRLEFKEQFPPGGDERNEFIRHVAGMANTSGGRIIVGIKERRDAAGQTTGEAGSIAGLDKDVIDSECLRLANTIKSNVRPQITPSPRIYPVSTSHGVVIIIDIRTSVTRPHMHQSMFHARQGAQTVRLEVDQVRSAFSESEGLSRQLAEFRASRLAEIIGGESRLLLGAPANMIVHVCPFESFGTFRRIDVEDVNSMHIAPPGPTGEYTYRLNLAGAISSSGPKGEIASYLQIFENGCVEYATTTAIKRPTRERPYPQFQSRTVTNILARELPQCIDQLGAEMTPYPLALMTTFIGTRGARASLSDDRISNPIEEERALLQPLRIDERPSDWPQTIRQILDSIWRALGYGSCPHFDREGRINVIK